MTPDPDFGYEHLMTELIRGVIHTVADLPGLTEAQRLLRHQTTVYAIMGLQPRDAVETMLAGHCVIYDHLLRDGARDLLRGQAEQIKLRARPSIHGSRKMFLTALATLSKMQLRPADTISVPRRAEASPKQSAPPAAPNPPPQPMTAKPRFVCERVHPPRSAPTPTPPRFGAAWRVPDAEKPTTIRGRLRDGVSRISLLVATRSEGARAMPSEPVEAPVTH
jgi:hypothetical protein